MGWMNTVKRWFGMLFKKKAETEFNVQNVTSQEMEISIERCARIYRGRPEWVDVDKRIKTINFAKSICSEIARLTTLAIGITIDGSPRADWLQTQIDKVYFQVRHWVEFGAAYGTIVVKPNGNSFDMFTPSDFIITECDNQQIRGIIFIDKYSDNGKYYTRFEYHRFVEMVTDGTVATPYYVSNKAYVSDNADSLGSGVALKKTKWASLMDETPPILKANGEPLDGPLFGVLRTPQANNIDANTPLGLPAYAEAIEELRDLDVAYSRQAGEVYDSEKIILADDRLMFGDGQNLKNRHPKVKLPHYVKNVFGQDMKEFYQEINPQLNTETRLTGINALLSQIGYKVGFSNGYFVFNERTGMITATQVESDDRRTIQLIKDYRDKLENCMDDAIYAMSVYADLYGLTPVGDYEITYDFGDITYNREEDRARWWGYVVAGKVPAWRYFVKFEGMSEADAKAMIDEAQPKEPTLFEEE